MSTTESSIKRCLLQNNDSPTPKKVLVECEINGWLETCEKNIGKNLPKPKFKITKKPLFNSFFEE